MFVINQVACGDNYTNAATIPFLYGASGGYAAIRDQPVMASLAWGVQGSEQYTDEFRVEPGNMQFAPNIIGVRFRNALPGQTATVTAVLSAHDEPPVYLTAAGVVPGNSPNNPHIDSTDNVGLPWGVQSISPIRGDEQIGYVLTSLGDGGSKWLAPLTAAGCTSFPDQMHNLVVAGNTLLGYWRLGDLTPPFLDSSGYSGGPANGNRQAAGTPMTLHVPGALPPVDDDGAVQFNNPTGGLGDIIRIAGETYWQNLDPFSVACWINPGASANTFTGTPFNDWIFPVAQPAGGWRLDVSWPARTLSFTIQSIGTGANATLTDPTPLVAGQWVFVVATYSSAAGMKLYVNGTLVASNSASIALSVANEGPHIGGDSFFTAVNTFFGSVDECSVWSVALTGASIASLYTSGQPCTNIPAGTTTANQVLTSNGDGTSSWLYPTVGINSHTNRFDELAIGAGLAQVNSGGGVNTLTADPSTQTTVWMPLTTTNSAGDDVLVFDASDQLIPTLTPF